MEDNQPKGIGFYNIKTGETHYARLEAQIQAYINSSDMGINASRDQDFGWRLQDVWVKKVRAFRRNETKMESLVARNGGQKPTTVQVLYAIYGEQLRAAQEQADENEAPFEQEYLASISEREKPVAPAVANPEPNNIPEDVDEADLMPTEEEVDNGDSSQATDSAPSATESVQEVNAASIGNQPTDSKAKSAKVKQK